MGLLQLEQVFNSKDHLKQGKDLQLVEVINTIDYGNCSIDQVCPISVRRSLSIGL